VDFDRILVALDGSQEARHALQLALSLTERLGSRLTAVAVEGKVLPYAATVGEVEESQREKDRVFNRVLDEAKAQAAELEIGLNADLLVGQPAKAIVRYAKTHRQDLIVVGQRLRVLGDYRPGSTADRVAHHAHCPVMVVR
jgi:nucleotide-binding universal stress UspA family protein